MKKKIKDKILLINKINNFYLEIDYDNLIWLNNI
jgi:hypothetical protein